MSSFSLSGGVEVFGFISPSDTTDTYPVIDPLYGIDGLRNVEFLSDLDNIPTLRRRAGMVVGVSGGTTYYKLNPGPWNNTITDWSIFSSGGGGVSGDYLPLSGGTVSGGTQFTDGLTANTISATTYQGISTITGGTYSAGTITFTNNNGGTFDVAGFYNPTTDPDAATFLTINDYALEIYESAINTFVKSLKETNLWTAYSALYPLLSDGINETRANQVKYNLINPIDSDAAYRLSFSGGVTYTSSGVLFGGVNGFASTFLSPSALGQNSLHLSVYSLTNTSGTLNDIGSQDNPLTSSSVLLIRDGTNNLTSRVNQSSSNSVANATSLGLYTINRTASNVVNVWRGNTKIINTTTASATPNNFDIYLGARNDGGTATLFSNREYGFASIGRGLTDDEVYNASIIIQRFMFDTGRIIYRYN